MDDQVEALLAARARSVTAVDAAPEALALARRRVRDLPVQLIQADVFGWRPPRRYDTVFFAFWLTHVPPARFAAFWSAVGAVLAPGGRACFIDDSTSERAHEKELPDQTTPTVWRRLRDGGERRVVKVYYSPAELAARLAELGWSQAPARPTTASLSEPPVRWPEQAQRNRSRAPAARAGGGARLGPCRASGGPLPRALRAFAAWVAPCRAADPALPRRRWRFAL